MQARFTVSRPQYQQFVEVTEPDEIARLTKLYETFSVSDKNLEARYKIFLRDLEEAESIDDLTLTREQEAAPKADYFFANRTVIGELKALYLVLGVTTVAAQSFEYGRPSELKGLKKSVR